MTDVENEPEIIVENVEPDLDKAEPIIEPIFDKAEPKKKGRPAGVKDRKPRPKRKVVIEEIEEDEPDPPIPHPEGRVPIPQYATYARNDSSALMLQLLNHQAKLRQQSKRDLHRSWFVH